MGAGKWRSGWFSGNEAREVRARALQAPENVSWLRIE
jgi:hypothetical protein